ncbi:MAG: hypothetical protein ACUVSF_01490 [Anaerolineae bacterium]
MLTANQRELFYPDLSRPAVESTSALVHLRFSTNMPLNVRRTSLRGLPRLLWRFGICASSTASLRKKEQRHLNGGAV